MRRNATESVVEKLLQDWDLTEDKVPENDCSVPDAATVFSGRDDHNTINCWMLLMLHIGVGLPFSLKQAIQAGRSPERLPEQG